MEKFNCLRSNEASKTQRVKMNCSGNIKREPMDIHEISPSLGMDKLDVNIVKSEPGQDFEMGTKAEAAEVSMDYYFYNKVEGLNEGPENVTTTTLTTSSPRLGTRSRRTSRTKLPEILKFFGNIENVNDSSGKMGVISATCNACQSRIRGSMSVTSNFIKHLRIKHFEIHAAFVKSKKFGLSDTSAIIAPNSSGSNGDALPQTSDLNSFDNRILEYIIDTTSPISTVERNSFRKLFKGTKLRVMSCSKLVERLDDRYSQLSQYINRIICNQKYLCTTADIWSIADNNFLIYTAHWLNEKYERHSIALAFRKLTRNPNDKILLLNVINGINCEYNIKDATIVATITNNGSRNYVNIFQQFGINYHNDIDFKSIEIESNTLPKQIECASHSLNILITTDFIEIISTDKDLRDRHMQIFNKLSHLWDKCEQPWALKVIVEILGEPLITPNVTKCKSIYDAICSILSHKEQLMMLCGQLDLPDIKFTTNDIQYLIEYRSLISPIAATIEFLENESNLYYGCLIPALTSLYVKLKRICKESYEVNLLKNAALYCLEVLKKRFAIYFNLTEDANQAIVAAVLCPSVKMRWFNALANICPNGRKTDDIHRIVVAEAVRYAKISDNSKILNAEDLLTVPPPQECDDFYEFGDIDETSNLDSPLSNLTDIINVQLQSYLRDTGTTFEIFEKYPLLQDLAIKFNTCLPSSAPVERFFSFSNIGRCEQSGDYSIERLLLIKANCGLLKKLIIMKVYFAFDLFGVTVVNA